jgi:GNAT superfamily N-acetyltransferase
MPADKKNDRKTSPRPAVSAGGISELLKECHENFVEVFVDIAQAMPGGAVERCEELVVVRTGLPEATFNPVFALEPPRRIDGIAEHVNRMLVRTDTPWTLVTTPVTSATLAPLIAELNLKQFMVLPGMVHANLPDMHSFTLADLDIHRVTKNEEFRVYNRTCTEGEGMPPDLFGTRLDQFIAKANDLPHKMGFYLGYIAGQPVSTSARFTTRRTAGIYLVSTLPSSRRRGYGAALTARAAMDGIEDGCTISYLQASDMGRPVYEKMGYRVVEEYQYWVPASAAGEKTPTPTRVFIPDHDTF